MTSAEQAASEETAGRDSFYRELDQNAKEILAMVGSDVNIIIVPNSFMMQHGNDSLFLKKNLHKNNYRSMIEGEAERGVHGVIDPRKMSQLMQLDAPVILLKESALKDQNHLGKCARVWHEYGHKIDDAETGDVFEHEVRTVAKQLGKEAAQEWLRRAGKDGVTRLVYIARTATSKGIDNLTAALTEILTAEELETFQKIRKEKGGK
ncbi:MAG: hypothetical protein ACRDTC_20685 [Pseudonocardiaceae bacterium]